MEPITIAFIVAVGSALLTLAFAIATLVMRLKRTFLQQKHIALPQLTAKLKTSISQTRTPRTQQIMAHAKAIHARPGRSLTVEVDGKTYESLAEASRQLGISRWYVNRIGKIIK
jgi:ABC-type spermidine/putrescine transport system permease subunit II